MTQHVVYPVYTSALLATESCLTTILKIHDFITNRMKLTYKCLYEYVYINVDTVATLHTVSTFIITSYVHVH